MQSVLRKRQNNAALMLALRVGTAFSIDRDSLLFTMPMLNLYSVTNDNDTRPSLPISSQEQPTDLSTISVASSSMARPETVEQQVPRQKANTIERVPAQAIMIEHDSQADAAVAKSPGLFVPEQTPSVGLDSDIEEIARPTSAVRPVPHNVPASPADSVMTESSPLARWERRKLPLDRLAAITGNKQSSSIDIKGTISQGSRVDDTRPTCGSLPQKLTGPGAATWAPTSTSHSLPAKPKFTSTDTTAKRRLSPATTTDHDRPRKVHQGERVISKSSEPSSQPLQQNLANSKEVTKSPPTPVAKVEQIPQIRQEVSITTSNESLRSPLLASSNSNDSVSSLSLQPRSLPSWYTSLEGTTTSYSDWHHTQADRKADAALRTLKQSIDAACSSLSARPSKLHDDAVAALRDCLRQFLVSHPVKPRMLYEHRMLHPDASIRHLTDRVSPDTVEWPFDIKADAREIHRRWWKGQFDPSMFRGIILGKTRNPSTVHDHSADKLDPAWSEKFKRKGGDGGPNKLINGQWWPTQLAAVRDGAHGNFERYITHNPKRGAVSCILHGGPAFSNNVDEGNVVLLSTSGGHDGNSLPGRTLAMLQRHKVGGPIRLLRSSSINSEYAPKAGLRYDGLYDVVEVETRPQPSDPDQHFRFRLVRCAGQDPIRHQAPYARPTQQELDIYAKLKRSVRFDTELEDTKEL